MVSVAHEGVIELFRDRPKLLLDLLRQPLLGHAPRLVEPRPADTVFNQLVAAEYSVDAVMLQDKGAATIGTIVETQRTWDPDKLFSWPYYVVAARARHRCPFRLIVITPDEAVVNQASQPIDVGCGTFQAEVLGPAVFPKIVEAEHAAQNLQLAMLSVFVHGQGDVTTAVQIADAAISAVLSPLAGLPRDRQRLYYKIIIASLSNNARKEFSMFLPDPDNYFVREHRLAEERSMARGLARGKAEGKAEAVLRFLQLRSIKLTGEQRRAISDCRDAVRLDEWLDRAAVAASADDLFAGPTPLNDEGSRHDS